MPPCAAVDFDREQRGQRRVGDAVLDAVDHPGIAGAYRGGLHVGVARFRSMIMDTERRIAVGLELRERQMIAVVGQERRQEARRLLRRHQPVEQGVGERRGARQHGGDIGVSQRQFLRHDAGGKRVGAGTARIFGQRERAQPKLRCFIEHVGEQGPRARLETLGPKRARFDLVSDEISHGVADFQLLRAELKIVHSRISGGPNCRSCRIKGISVRTSAPASSTCRR